MTSNGHCTSVKVALPSGEEFLMLEITIDCPACGQYTMRIAGHHLRMIRDMLIETIDQYPDLTGKDGDVQVLNRLRAAGPVGDPTNN